MVVLSLQAEKARIYMFSFAPEAAEAKNDLTRLHSTGAYQRACLWDLHAHNDSHAQSVSALGCVNSVASPILLCATSDRYAGHSSAASLNSLD